MKKDLDSLDPGPYLVRISKNKYRHKFFPLSLGPVEGQQHKGISHKVGMESGLEVNLKDSAMLVLLSRQDVSNNVVPVEVLDIKDRGSSSSSTSKGRGQIVPGAGEEGVVFFNFSWSWLPYDLKPQ